MLNIPNEVKTILLKDYTRKNIRIIFPNGERADIINNSIVQNSVKLTESMCSQNDIKFGLCESSTFECEVVGIENIKDYQIRVQLEVDISSCSEEFIAQYGHYAEDIDFPFYVIPYGVFTVDTCQKQADMSHRRITAYNVNIPERTKNYEPLFLQDKLMLDSVSKPRPTRYGFNPFMLSMDCFAQGKADAMIYTELEPEDDSIQQVYVHYSQYTGEIDETITIECKSFFRTLDLNADYLFYDDSSVIAPALTNEIVDELYEIIKSRHGYAKPENIMEAFSPRIGAYDLSSSKAFNDYVYVQGLNTRVDGSFCVVYLPYKIRYSMFGFGVLYEKDIRNTSECHLLQCTVPEMMEHRVDIKYEKDAGGTLYPSVALPDLFSLLQASVEIEGCFGKFERNGIFNLVPPSSVENLYPSETLYPSDSLFPQGTQGYSVPSTYSSAWYDEITKPYGRVQASFRNADGEDEISIFDLVPTFDSKKYRIYDMSDNFLIRDGQHLRVNVDRWLQKVANNIKNIRYMPCDIKSMGMPWLEAGDTIALETSDGDIIKTIILSRTLTGEQYITDNYVSF